MNRVCPKCHSDGESLWQEVVGWQDFGGGHYSAVHDTETTGLIGCSCGWEGSTHHLVQVDSYGKVIPEPIPGQMIFNDT